MERPSGPGCWGWFGPVRMVLAMSAVAGGLGLLAIAGPVGPIAESPDSLRIDPNTVPPQILGALPRVGPALAAAIVAERDRKPFASLNDMDRRVRGIGPATRESLRPFLRFDP